MRPEAWVEDSRYHDGAAPARVLVVAARANLIARPNAGGHVIGTARRGETLNVVRASRDDRWFLVELGGAEVAWIAAAAVKPQKGSAPVGESPTAPPPIADPIASPTAPRIAPFDEPAARPVRKRRRSEPAPVEEPPIEPPILTSTSDSMAAGEAAIPVFTPSRLSLSARAGVALLGERFTSNALGYLTNYEASATAFAVAVEAGFRLPIGRLVLLGLDGAYRFAGATGFRVAAPGGDLVLGIERHDIDAGGTIGLRADLLGGMIVSLRAGVRLLLELIDQRSKAPLPSDRIAAMQVGLRLDLPSLLPCFGVRIDGALIAFGSIAETGGLGEGQGAGTLGGTVGVEFGYRFGNGVGIDAGYRFTEVATDLSGPAERDPAITQARRSSTASLLTAGLSFAY